MLFLSSKQRLTNMFTFNYRLIAGFALSLMLVGCAQTQKMDLPEAPLHAEAADKAPHWVSALPVDSDYFYAIGNSQAVNGDQKAAEQAATENAQLALNNLIKASLTQEPYIKPVVDGLVPGDLERQLRARITQSIALKNTFNAETASVFFNPKNQKMYVLVKSTKQSAKGLLMTSLTELDTQLADYKHTSAKGSHLAQLLSLAPALPTLEARAQLHNAINVTFGDVPALPNDTMAFLMDRKVTILFDELVITVDALTPETAHLEPQIIKALRAADLKVSAHRPDLSLKYYIEMDVQTEGEQSQVTLINDIEFINRNSTPFAAFSEEITETASTPEEAQNKAMATLADTVKEIILQQIEEYIVNVNKLNFDR